MTNSCKHSVIKKCIHMIREMNVLDLHGSTSMFYFRHLFRVKPLLLCISCSFFYDRTNKLKMIWSYCCFYLVFYTHEQLVHTFKSVKVQQFLDCKDQKSNLSHSNGFLDIFRCPLNHIFCDFCSAEWNPCSRMLFALIFFFYSHPYSASLNCVIGRKVEYGAAERL